jgi:transcriptional regulator of acetoin/glycerol metabolism
MKTIKQIAEELGVPKQQVYRYIKKYNISVSHEKQGVMYFDDTAKKRIKRYFLNDTTSGDSIIDSAFSMLKQELEYKNQLICDQQQTIKDLTTAVKTQAESMSHKPRKKRYNFNEKPPIKTKTSIPIKRLMVRGK